MLRKKNNDAILTIIEWIASASNNLESLVASESVLEFIPRTFAMLATVTQMDDHGHRRRTSAACIIGAKPTTTSHLQLLHNHSFYGSTHWPFSVFGIRKHYCGNCLR